MSQVIISLAQMDVRLGNPRTNWTNMQQMTQTAKTQGAQLVLFPELWDAGYALKQAKELASSLSGGLFTQVANLAKQTSIYITGSMLEKRGMGIANSAPVFSPERGILGVYRKIHLFPLMDEDQYLTPGESTLTIQMPWGATSVAICYDLRFPELFRRYALEGAKLVVIPSEWPQPRLDAFRTLLRARAIENGIYIATCNRVGTDVDETSGKETTFFGHSSVIDPWGNIVVEAGSTEGVFTVPLDLTEVDKAQTAIPVLRGRRPEYYGNM